jgi:hypothetical protein
VKVKMTFEELRQLRPHPLCALLNSESYKPADEDLAALRTSIAQHGVRARAVLVPGEDGEPVVLDGWNTIQQFMAVYGHGRTEADVEAALNELAGNMEFLDDFQAHADSYVEGAQLGRRTFNSAQRAAFVLDSYNSRNRDGPSLSRETLAEIAKVSVRTVARVRQIDKEGCTELQHAIRIRRVSIDDAIDLIELSRGQQTEVLDRLRKDPQAVKAAVAAIRAERVKTMTPAPATEPPAAGSAATDGPRTDVQQFVSVASARSHSRSDIFSTAPTASPMRNVEAVLDEIAAQHGVDRNVSAAAPPVDAFAVALAAKDAAVSEAVSGIQNPIRTAWHAATLAERKEFAVMDGDQVVAMRRDATVRPPTGPSKAEVLRVAEAAKRAMPRNEHVQLMAVALHEWSAYIP